MAIDKVTQHHKTSAKPCGVTRLSMVKTFSVHKLTIVTDGDGAMHAQMFVLLIFCPQSDFYSTKCLHQVCV